MSYKKEAHLKNLEWMSNELIKIASNKDLSLTDELKQIKALKQIYLNKQASISVDVFNKQWIATPVTKEGKLSYEISDGKNKLLSISPLNGKEMNADHLKWAVERELTNGYKQARLTTDIGFMKKGSKVWILSNDGKRAKFANLEEGIRGYVPSSKIQLVALESQKIQHNGHSDMVLGASGTETLLDCVDAGPIWISSTELLDNNRPPATPEALNDLESAKDCPDCHGIYVGKENETCPTCGRFAVKEALMTAIPQSVTDQDAYLNNPPVEKKAAGCDQCDAVMINGVFCHEQGCPNQKRTQRDLEDEDESFWPHNASLKIQAHIRHEDGKWIVYNHDYTKKLGTYPSKSQALKRLRQIEYFKSHKGSLRPFSKKAEVLSNPYQSLTDHITDMKSRMSQVQERLQSNPLPKQAGEEDNSTIDLPELFEDLTMGIDLLETKLGGDDIEPELHKSVEDLENLLWTIEEQIGITPKLNNHEKEEPEHKEIVEQVEKEAATTSGTVTTTVTSPSLVTPAAPTNTTPQTDDAPSNAPDDASPSCALCGGLTFADFAAYQNHMDYTHASDTAPTSPTQKLQPTNVTSKKKVADVVTDETITEETNDPNAILTDPTLTPIAPTISNVMPTDNDNLEIPVAMPSSPPSPGQKWVFDTENNVYVSMPDSAHPGKTI